MFGRKRKRKLPKVVSPEEWQARREALLKKEKAATKARDRLAAERRRLPMVRIEKEYEVEGPEGRKTLRDLFDGRNQLIVYHFMFAPGVSGWPDAGCDGCSFVIDQIPHLAHLHARDITFVAVSKAPIENIERYRQRMGWTIPWFSSAGSDFNSDFGLSSPSGEIFGLSVFLRDDDNNVYRTYFTSGRGVEMLGTPWAFFDLVPYGRQEDWEKSPRGWPKGPRYEWWRRHDEYGEERAPSAQVG